MYRRFECRIQSIYGDAASAMAELVAKVGDDRRASLPDKFHELAVSDEYDFFSGIMPKIVAVLPRAAIDFWDARLEKEIRSLGPIAKEDRDWERRIKTNRLSGCDRPSPTSIRTSTPSSHWSVAVPRTASTGWRSANGCSTPGGSGKRWNWCVKLHMVDRLDRPMPRIWRGSVWPTTPISIGRGWKSESLQAMGDAAAAQALRWRTFEATLDPGLFRDHIAHLADFEDSTFLIARSPTRRVSP